MRFQEASRTGLGVADDGGEDDCAVDHRAAAGTGGDGGGVEDAAEFFGDRHRGFLAWRKACVEAADLLGNVGLQGADVDATRQHDPSRVVVFGQRQKQVVEGDLGVGLFLRILGGTGQRLPERRRHRYRCDLIGDVRPHAMFPFKWPARPTWKPFRSP